MKIFFQKVFKNNFTLKNFFENFKVNYFFINIHKDIDIFYDFNSTDSQSITLFFESLIFLVNTYILFTEILMCSMLIVTACHCLSLLVTACHCLNVAYKLRTYFVTLIPRSNSCLTLIYKDIHYSSSH